MGLLPSTKAHLRGRYPGPLIRARERRLRLAAGPLFEILSFRIARDDDTTASYTRWVATRIPTKLLEYNYPERRSSRLLVMTPSPDSARPNATRSSWLARWLSDLSQDLRYALRGMRRDAGFTAFAILIAGLGIGASSCVFSVVNALLLRPLPFRDPARLVWISNTGTNNGEWSTQVNHFVDLRAQNKSFIDIAGYDGFYSVGNTELTSEGEPERLTRVPVTQNFFPLLGVSPEIGRNFTDDESRQKVGSPEAVILSHALWQRHFNADPNIIGRKLTLNSNPVTVIGVMPASFDFSSVFAPATPADMFVPWPLTDETNQDGNSTKIVGRLAPGATVRSAQAEFTVLGKQLSEEHIHERNPVVPRIVPLTEHISGAISPALVVLACAVGVVMLIVCANLSNLQLARMGVRQKEMAVRAALGAGRLRLLRQLLTESVALSAVGAAVGLLLAFAGTRFLAHLTTFDLPLLASVHIDAQALAFTLGAAILTGLLFGILPAIQVQSFAIHGALKDSARGATGGKRHAYVRNALVIGEIALACALLVGASLLIRSFLRVLDVDLGFQPERAAAMRVDPSFRLQNMSEENSYVDTVLLHARNIPGITAAGLTNTLPFSLESSWQVRAKGITYDRGHVPEAFIRVVSDGYIEAVGIRLVAGRAFTADDRLNTEPVAIVNQSLARTLWPGQDPIGQMVTQDGGRRVVGIVGDVRHENVESASGGEMYLPMRQYGSSPFQLVVRTALPPESLANAVRGSLREVDSKLPIGQFTTLETFVNKVVSPRRFLAMLLAGFAGFALLLASLGIYALISYSVNQRVREIGIRMALGASAANVRASILIRTLTLAAAGLALGLVVSRMLTAAIAGFLYGVTPGDPLTFVTMSGLLIAVAAAAGFVPARRASRIDPIVALRAE